MTNNKNILEEPIEDLRPEKAKLNFLSEGNSFYINQIFEADNRTLRRSKFVKKKDDTYIREDDSKCKEHRVKVAQIRSFPDPYSVPIRENMDQKNFAFGYF